MRPVYIRPSIRKMDVLVKWMCLCLLVRRLPHVLFDLLVRCGTHRSQINLLLVVALSGVPQHRGKSDINFSVFILFVDVRSFTCFDSRCRERVSR